MKRILVVDDEQHVVDHLVRIVEREVPSEFSVVGTASSGRETLEKVPQLQPDIVVLDVRMPGLSGLDTVRELQRRGSSAAFVLSTAYERFDIAREALELGVTGYLLKPVSRESLVQGLRNAAEQLDRRAEVSLESFHLQESALQARICAADAYLTGLMVGRGLDEGAQGLRVRLGIDKPWGLVAVAAFLHEPEKGRNDLETLLQYKSPALCGPLVFDRCLVFLPLSSPEEGPEAQKTLSETIAAGIGTDLDRGGVKLAFASPRPAAALASAWPEALARLSPRASLEASGQRFAAGASFDEEESFHAALAASDADRVRFSFEALLASYEDADDVAVQDRYRVIALLGSALGRLVGLGHLEESSAHQLMDFDDLRQAEGAREFCLMARSRLPLITASVSRAQRWSLPLSTAIEHVRNHYNKPLTLDSVAEVAGVTPKRLSRYFIEELGQGFSDFLIDYRIEKAKVLLALPGASIKQVSLECGYPDPNYFARLFKKVTGTTPSDFSVLS